MNPPLFQSVLLLEDDPAHALLIKRACKDFVQELTHVETCAGLKSFLLTNTPTLIVTDLNVPDARGVALIKEILNSRSDIPIIVLTSSTSLTDAVEAMKLGARDFVVKNFDGDFREIFALSLSRLWSALSVEEARRKLEREMQILRVAIENSADGLAVARSSGEISYSNSAFRSYVSIWEGDPTHLSKLLSQKIAKYESAHETLIERALGSSQGGVWSTELSINGIKDVAFELSISGIPSAENVGSSSVLWIRDRSSEKRREKFQREILSTTTHDLKGPLGAIILSAELVPTMMHDQNKITALALRIGSAAQGAVNLIDEFLSARRIQEGTFILRPTDNDLSTVFEEGLMSYQTMAAAKSISLTLSKPSSPVSAKVDKLSLVRVLGNLVSNAIKFTPKGGTVTISLESSTDEVTFSVCDSGTGMEASEVATIFERFSRLSKHNEVDGTGLGLFVVKSIVSAHGGRIEVSSAPGNGSTFRCTLPKHPPTNDKGELYSLDFA